MEENMIAIKDPKPFCFKSDWPKDVGDNWKLEIEFIIISSESLAKNEIKTILKNCC